MARTAKHFIGDCSQVGRLPTDLLLDASGKEGRVRRDPENSALIPPRKPATWDGFFEARAFAQVPDDFLGEQDRGPCLEAYRDPFEGWIE